MSTCFMCRRPNPTLFWAGIAVSAVLCFAAPEIADRWVAEGLLKSLVEMSPFILFALVLPYGGRRARCGVQA